MPDDRGLLQDLVSLLLQTRTPIGPMRDRKDYPAELQRAIDFLHGRGMPSAVTCLKHPQSHDEAMKRIGECVREIEMISDAFGYDPFEWLADDEETEKRSATSATYEAMKNTTGLYKSQRDNKGKRRKLPAVAKASKLVPVEKYEYEKARELEDRQEDADFGHAMGLDWPDH